jgi:hypothetical protein
MHLLQSGVDLSVIALWLGHESPSTTHIYMEADLLMKERALEKLHETESQPIRYKADDALLHFLENLLLVVFRKPRIRSSRNHLWSQWGNDRRSGPVA